MGDITTTLRHVLEVVLLLLVSYEQHWRAGRVHINDVTCGYIVVARGAEIDHAAFIIMIHVAEHITAVTACKQNVRIFRSIVDVHYSVLQRLIAYVIRIVNPLLAATDYHH